MKRKRLCLLTSAASFGLCFLVTTFFLPRTSLRALATGTSSRSILYDLNHNSPEFGWSKDYQYEAKEGITGGNVGSFVSTRFRYTSSDGSNALLSSSTDSFVSLIANNISQENPPTYTLKFDFFVHDLRGFSFSYKSMANAPQSFSFYGFLGDGSTSVEKTGGDISRGLEQTWEWNHAQEDGEVDHLVFEYQVTASPLSSGFSCSILSMTLAWVC
jgi:hypothetical protein